MNTSKICREVYKMEEYDLFQVLDAAILRWREMHPDWEIYTVSAPRNDPEWKKRTMEFVFEMMDRESEQKPTHVSQKDLL